MLILNSQIDKKEYNIDVKSQTENLRVVKRYENNIANIKEKYDTITNKIKNQDLAMIETSRNSIRSSIIQSQRQLIHY